MKTGISPKGLVHGFGKKKMKLFHLLIFGKKQTNKQTNSPQNVFDAILERKKVFLESKIRKLKKLKNRDFSKRVSLWFWSKS